MRDAFAYPNLLLALAVLPIVSVLGVLATRRRQRALVQLAGLTGALRLLTRKPARLGRLCVSLGLTCLVLGMAGPRWGRDWGQSAAPGRDLVVVLDLSRSMFAEAPSRLERACAALEDLAAAFRLRGGQRLALIVFAGQPRLVCPLTHDLDHFREAIAAIDRSVPDATLGSGTRIGAALVLAVDSFDGRSTAARDVVLLSDGDDPARDGEWQRGGERARAESIPIHCVAIGDGVERHRIPMGKEWLTHDGDFVRTRLEEAPLRALVQRTGGQLFRPGPGTFALGDHYLALASTRGHDEDSPDSLPVYRTRQGWFLLPAFVLLLLSLFLLPGGHRP